MRKRSRARRRRELKDLVDAGDADAIVAWARGTADAPALLVTRLIDRDDRKRWTATVALSRVLGEVAARGDLEPVRVIIRRLLWNMMDESGGLAWHGPEAIAEILFEVPELQVEYGRIAAAYVDEGPFEASALYLMARLAPRDPEQFDDLVPRLVDALDWPDPFARAQALRALAVLRPHAARVEASRLLDDDMVLPEYDAASATVGETTVGRIARDIFGEAEAARPEPARRVAAGC